MTQTRPLRVTHGVTINMDWKLIHTLQSYCRKVVAAAEHHHWCVEREGWRQRHQAA